MPARIAKPQDLKFINRLLTMLDLGGLHPGISAPRWAPTALNIKRTAQTEWPALGSTIVQPPLKTSPAQISVYPENFNPSNLRYLSPQKGFL